MLRVHGRVHISTFPLPCTWHTSLYHEEKSLRRSLCHLNRTTHRKNVTYLEGGREPLWRGRRRLLQPVQRVVGVGLPREGVVARAERQLHSRTRLRQYSNVISWQQTHCLAQASSEHDCIADKLVDMHLSSRRRREPRRVGAVEPQPESGGARGRGRARVRAGVARRPVGQQRRCGNCRVRRCAGGRGPAEVGGQGDAVGGERLDRRVQRDLAADRRRRALRPACAANVGLCQLGMATVSHCFASVHHCALEPISHISLYRSRNTSAWPCGLVLVGHVITANMACSVVKGRHAVTSHDPESAKVRSRTVEDGRAVVGGRRRRHCSSACGLVHGRRRRARRSARGGRRRLEWQR